MARFREANKGQCSTPGLAIAGLKWARGRGRKQNPEKAAMERLQRGAVAFGTELQLAGKDPPGREGHLP